MKTLARSLSLVVALGGGAVLHADTAATPAPAHVLSPADMAARAATLRTQIVEDNQKVMALKEQARKLKDVIKLNCVNDKQIQVKAEMNIADLANDQLQGTLQKNGGDDRQAAFAQLVGAGDAIRRLREEAAACIGEPELFKQEQGGTVESPDIVDDPTGTNPFQGGELEPPDSASR
ncbi:MAG TPA: hypothetical protein VGG74_15655 [Kofleriaceae bacterium]|jgi:hypothetical protein